MTDSEAVKEIVAHKSERAFKILYQRHGDAIYRIAVRLAAGDIPFAEDLTQEAWCIAVGRLKYFRWQSQIRTWLVGILINVFKNQSRKKGRSQAEQLPIPPTEVWQSSLMDLKNAINRLPEGCREILILHDIEGYKHHEIAAMLEISEGTSKSQLSNARKSVRLFLSN